MGREGIMDARGMEDERDDGQDYDGVSGAWTTRLSCTPDPGCDVPDPALLRRRRRLAAPPERGRAVHLGAGDVAQRLVEPPLRGFEREDDAGARERDPLD